MRSFLCIALAIAFGALGAGCGPDSHTAEPGNLTLDFKPAPPTMDADLQVTQATLRIDHIAVLGDAPPPHGDPPPPLPPVTLDLLASGAALEIPKLPQGLYSRVLLSFDEVSIRGTWKGTPFVAEPLPPMFPGPMVSLRTATPVEVAPGQDVSLTVTVDGASWLSGNLLDQGVPMNGSLTVDPQNNTSVAMALVMRIANSFALQ